MATKNAKTASIDPIVTQFRETMYKLYYPQGLNEQNHADALTRPLVCTPVKGDNETISQWVISVNGSPPKGTLVIDGKADAQAPVFFLKTKFDRVKGSKQLESIHTFCAKYLKGKDTAFTLNA
jgi:hypothetical protein